MKLFFLLFCQFVIIGCSSIKQKKEHFGTSKLTLQVKNKSDIPLLVNRLQTYSKIANNKVSSSVDNNNLSVEIFDLLTEEKIANLFRLNGSFKIKGNNNTVFTEDKFRSSFSSFPEASMVFIFDSIYKKELETFSRDNLKQKTEVFLGNTCVASPTFMNTINNGLLGLTPTNSDFDTYIVHTASTVKYPHNIAFNHLNYKVTFKDSVISKNLFQQYQSIKNYPLGHSVNNHKEKFLEKYSSDLSSDRIKVLQKLDAVILMLSKIYSNDLLSFIKKSNFSSYTELELFITKVNSIQENYKSDISTIEEVVNSLQLITNSYNSNQ